MSSPYAFSFEPLFLALGVGVLIAYLRARPAPWWRVALFAGGLVLVVAPLNSPLETIATERLLLIHLLQNVMLADWAPPLLILGLTPAMRAGLARRGGPPMAFVTRPRIALPVWLLGWYGIHWGFFYDFALRHPIVLNLEHLLLLGIGLLFWWPLLSDEPQRLSIPVKIAYLGAAFVTSVFLGLAFIFSASPFYAFYAHAPRLWGLSATKDQNLGGILMNGEQTVVFLAAIAYFLWQLLEEESRAAG